MEDINLLNSISYKGKTYSIDDLKGMMTPEEFGLPVGFYGGRVTNVGRTLNNNVFMLLEGMQVIDLMVKEAPVEKVDYTEMTNATLKGLLEEKGITIPRNATKQMLIDLLD